MSGVSTERVERYRHVVRSRSNAVEQSLLEYGMQRGKNKHDGIWRGLSKCAIREPEIR